MKITFIDAGSGYELIPDDWHGEIPRMDEEYTMGDSCYTVVGLSTDERLNVTADLHLNNHPAPMESKDTNPKDAIGISKSPLSVIPTPFLHMLGLAMMEGALKYGRHNYRAAGIRYSVYYDAMMRHMNAWWEGEDIDPDSGLPHPVKAAACMAILCDALVMENGNDDRPPPAPAGWMDAVNKHAQNLLERFPNPLPPHTAE